VWRASVGCHVPFPPEFREERPLTERIHSETESNRSAIRQAFEAWQQGTASITNIFAPGMIWRIEGHSAASGGYQSRQHANDGKTYENSYAWS
jgi:hypothetical protein